MRFTVDVGELAVVLELDTEPAEVDLTRDGLGDRCLDAAVEGMLGSHGAQRAPDGTPWPPLSAATVRRKGHAVIGRGSGLLLNPHRWRTAPRDILSRVAIWYDPSTGWKGEGHRPLTKGELGDGIWGVEKERLFPHPPLPISLSSFASARLGEACRARHTDLDPRSFHAGRQSEKTGNASSGVVTSPTEGLRAAPRISP